MKRTFLLLVAIFALGLVLRVVNLSTYPIGFTPDEAAFGYNAYSLLLTGKDEWGTPAYILPVTNLKSFGDYKLPLYAFLTVPSIKIFGLNELAARLPGGVVGSLAIFSLFFLTLQLTRSHFISLAAAFFMAVSPWGISLSRGAFEANLATFLIPMAIYLLLSKKYLFSAIFFSLAFYSYHSARFLVIPVIALCFIYQYFQNRTFPKAKFLIFLIVLLLPGFISFFGSGLSRAADVGIFHPTDNWQALSADRFAAAKLGLPNYLARIYYAKPLSVITLAVSNYLSYFSPQYLFASGAGESTYGLMPDTPLLYLIELPLLILFVAQLTKRPSKEMFLLLLLILLMPLPAALAKGPGFAANRSVLMLPFLSIAAGIGLKNIRRYSIPVILISMISLSGFLVSYAYQSPQSLAQGMLYGRRELFTKLQEMEASASQIRVSRNLSESHIYVAFYNSLPPRDYQVNTLRWSSLGSNGFTFLDQTDYSLGKYYFGNLSFGGNDPSTILVGRPQDFEIGYPRLFVINSPAGDPLLQVSPLRI